MFSAGSWAEWTFFTQSVDENKVYLDIDRIQKNGGYVYVWSLVDYIKPDKWGDMSAKRYYEVDCKALRYKPLTNIYYKEPMGEGSGESSRFHSPEWVSPSPNSIIESMLNTVCAQ